MNRKFMQAAIAEAKAAKETGDIPVGAVIVKDGEIIAYGRNTRERDNCATGHAEINAINSACEKLDSWRLSECELYVTLEPCPMCAGAIINSRISTVIFGAYDVKAGSCDSVINLFNLPYNHKPEVYGGICEAECASLLSKFFDSKLRSGKKL